MKKNKVIRDVKKPLMNFFFEMLINIKVAHLTTTSFAAHKATDKLYDDINELYDKFLEIYIGIYGRPLITEKQDITYNKMTGTGNERIVSCINHCINFLTNDIMDYISEKDTELLNIRDEMKGALNRTLYLLTLS